MPLATHGPIKDILLVGFGAVGAICPSIQHIALPLQSFHSNHASQDSLILKNSGRARVTVIARGNYEIVNGNTTHLVGPFVYADSHRTHCPETGSERDEFP